MNRAWFTGDFFVQNLCDFIKGVDACMEGVLHFLRRSVADGAVSPLCVVPVDPLQGFPLDPGHGFPRAEELDDPGPEQADDAFRQGVVTTVANATDRGVNPGLRQTFGIADCEILAAAVPVMDQRDGSTRRLQPDTAGRPLGSGRPARSPSSSTSRRASRRSCGRGHQ